MDVVFALMCEPPENDENEEYFVDDDDESTPTTNATQTLDVLALHLPPQKLITPVVSYSLSYVDILGWMYNVFCGIIGGFYFQFEHVSAGLAGDNLYVKKASYLALAMLAEGCADCIRTKCLKMFLECVCRGITDPAPVVRNAALFALGQFSEHLQVTAILPQFPMYAGGRGHGPAEFFMSITLPDSKLITAV